MNEKLKIGNYEAAGVFVMVIDISQPFVNSYDIKGCIYGCSAYNNNQESLIKLLNIFEMSIEEFFSEGFE